MDGLLSLPLELFQQFIDFVGSSVVFGGPARAQNVVQSLSIAKDSSCSNRAPRVGSSAGKLTETRPGLMAIPVGSASTVRARTSRFKVQPDGSGLPFRWSSSLRERFSSLYPAKRVARVDVVPDLF